MCKVFGSEAGPRAADFGLQIMGGYGYLTEYGMEQIWRDARICAIYEGTNGIHTRALATRGLKSGGGADAFKDFILQLSNTTVSPDKLAHWMTLKEDLQASDDPAESAREFYEASAALFLDAVWLKINAVADHHPDAPYIKTLAARALGAV